MKPPLPIKQIPRAQFILSCAVALPILGSYPAHAIVQVALDSTWSEWDPTPVQTLSGQSATGFTTEVSGTTAETGAIPQVYQIFNPLRLSEVGDKVELSFDVQFNTALGAVNLDTDFRFGLSSTANNSGAMAGVDAGGSAAGTSIRLRYDANGITWIGDPGDVAGTGYPNAFDENDLNHSLNASGTLGSTGGTPSGNVLGEDTTEVHSFVFSIERTAGGLISSLDWTDDNSGSSTVSSSYTSDYDDSALLFGKTNSIDMIQFALLEEDISTAYPASWVISNVTVTGEPVPEPSSLLLALGASSFFILRRRR